MGETDVSEHRSMEQALRAVLEGTAGTTGTEFFHLMVRHLAAALGVRYAFVAEFTQKKSRVRTLAFWMDDHFVDNFEYDVTGTPCMKVAAGETVYYTKGVQALFPEDRGVAELGLESYFGVPLLDRAGNQLGHLAVMDDKPMVKEFRGMAVLKIFAARACTELERKRAEQARQESEERLANILANAMDAIITIDDQQRITLFNAAAEKTFRCPAEQVMDQPLERLLSKRFSNLLKGYFLAVHPAKISSQHLWAPEGLTARRADGEEFPVEATISPLEVGGHRLYTIILRDVTERRRAEQAFHKLQLENIYLQEEVRTRHDADEIIGESAAMKGVLRLVEQVAGTDTTVLLIGETGTGKEVIARMIHSLSPRKDKLLIKLNCAALPEELVESELFGHEKGAFTGAIAQRKGRFELADGGTLFLDEVGELSASAQAKLLRVLQEQEFERVGGSRTMRVDVRVIAATNRDLAEMVKAGGFRCDLFYRLNIFPIQAPPLRERRSDIPLLARSFLDKFARKMGKPLHGIAPKAMERLIRYSWPGNVRELQNVIERAVILAQGPLLDVDNILERQPPSSGEAPVSGSLEEVERAHIIRVLEDAHWVIEGEHGAAKTLDLHPSTLRSKIQKLNIKKPASRA